MNMHINTCMHVYATSKRAHKKNIRLRKTSRLGRNFLFCMATLTARRGFNLGLEVAVRVVDQFPFLWDFVIIGETKMSILTANTFLPPRARTHMVCGFADLGEGNIGESAERVLYFIHPLTLFQCPNLESSKAPSTL